MARPGPRIPRARAHATAPTCSSGPATGSRTWVRLSSARTTRSDQMTSRFATGPPSSPTAFTAGGRSPISPCSRWPCGIGDAWPRSTGPSQSQRYRRPGRRTSSSHSAPRQLREHAGQQPSRLVPGAAHWSENSLLTVEKKRSTTVVAIATATHAAEDPARVESLGSPRSRWDQAQAAVTPQTVRMRTVVAWSRLSRRSM